MADNFINDAKNAIGESAPDDYILAPLQHANEFKARAPGLAEILSRSDVAGTVELYVEKDSVAMAAQREFRRRFGRANMFILVTAVLSALALAIGVLTIPFLVAYKQTILIVLNLLAAVTGALAIKDLNVIKNGKMLEDWMTKRAAAETYRLEYFKAIAQSKLGESTAGSIPVNLLKLEYFRRFQLDMQIAYYRDKARANEMLAKKNLSLSTLAITLAAIATAAAGVLSALNTQYSALTALGTMFTAVSAYMAMKEEIFQNRRNSERYARTLETLSGIRRKIDEVRTAVTGDEGEKPLEAFIDAVHEQLSLEHRQWLGEQSNLVTKLDEALKKSSAAQSAKPPATGGK